MLALQALICVIAYMASPVSAHAASQLSVQLVAARFKGAGIVPNVISTFDPIGTFVANYSGVVATTGTALSATNTSQTPTIISIKGTEVAEANSTGPFHPKNNSTATFTVILIDGNYPGSDNPNGYNLHWLGNGYKILQDNDHSLILGNASDVIPYAGPAPPEGTGPHRYIFLVYAEPSGFAAPSTPAANSGVQLFDLATYVSAAKLGDPIVGNYFTVENGTPTVSVAATTSINNATLPAATATTAGTDHHGSSTGSGTSSGAGSSPTSGAGYKVAVKATPWGVLVALGTVLLV